MTGFYNFNENSLAKTCSYGLYRSGLLKKREKKKGK